MIQLHVELLQNLQQALFVFNIPPSIDCTIQADQVVIKDEEQHCETTIHLNNLIIDINKGTEVASILVDGQIRRTFKFPFLRLPKITDHIEYNLSNVACAKCQTTLKVIAENQTYKIVQQQNANADDINEVVYCHRFCEAHQHDHEHEHPHQRRLHVPLDLHSELTVLETTECFVIAKEYISSELITNNELVQCHHCSSNLGSFNTQTNLVSFDKCSMLPFSNDYLSSCFLHHEPGRYIVKVPKSADSIFLVWILPNQILAADASITSSTQLNFHRMRKVLFTHITSPDHKLFTEWKRDFSVTTLLVNQLCLDQLSTTFQGELEKFPNVYNSNEAFQSLTIAF